jgi:hypothetical protein
MAGVPPKQQYKLSEQERKAEADRQFQQRQAEARFQREHAQSQDSREFFTPPSTPDHEGGRLYRKRKLTKSKKSKRYKKRTRRRQ